MLAALLLGALLLRVIPWLANLPLHHDEALYGTWARAIADGSDPLLLVPWIDKPPLVLYLLAFAIRVFGPSELALRAPGVLAGLLAVWATFGLARRIGGERVAWAAALLMTLSPFAILFAPTAFTDGWLTLFVIAAAWAALAGRPGWAGVLLGLAAASKQQGVMGVPLVLALVVLGNISHVGRNGLERQGAGEVEARKARWARDILCAIGVAALGFAVVFGAVTYWDSLRWHNRPSYWDQSLQTYGGVTLAPLAKWPARAAEWAGQAGCWFGVLPITALVLGLAAIGGRLRTDPRISEPSWRDSSIRSRLLLIYLIGYLLVHVAFTFQPWDRYLLPVLPLVCILCGEGLVRAWDAIHSSPRRRAHRWAAVPLAAVALYAAGLGATASIPVGSDIGAYHGVMEAAGFLAGQPPDSTVYFDRIGWHLGYYLYGKSIARSWYDSPGKLASEAARVAAERDGSAQWLVLPAWEESQLPDLAAALAAVGFVAQPAYEVDTRDGRIDLTLYRLERRAVAAVPARNDGPDHVGGQP